jgi:hypothetical protein
MIAQVHGGFPFWGDREKAPGYRTEQSSPLEDEMQPRLVAAYPNLQEDEKLRTENDRGRPFQLKKAAGLLIGRADPSSDGGGQADKHRDQKSST